MHSLVRSVLVVPTCLGVSLCLLSSVAYGQKKRSNVVEIAEITITGRVQKPVAAVDISRIAPKLSLADVRQPFLDKIEQAIYKDPFLERCSAAASRS